MPRGNDTEAQKVQLHELADQFGGGVGNAEQLIAANSARYTSDLAAISSLPVIQGDTDDLDLDKLEGPDGEYVLDAAVRGSGRTKGTVVVFQDEETGRMGKALIDKTVGPSPTGKRRSSHQKERGDAEAADKQASSGPDPAAKS